MNSEMVFVVAYRNTEDTESNKDAWQLGEFEPYYWYESEDKANKVAQDLNQELKRSRRTDTKVFVQKANRLWCERHLA